MGRALAIFVFLAALSALAIWLAESPGHLVIDWRGYEIRTSFVAGAAAALVCAFLTVFAYRLVATVLSGPGAFGSFVKERRTRKGYRALSRGMVAVAAGDAVEARRFSAQAQKLLDEPPLTLLLSAQAAQLEGDQQAATRFFERMLETPDTEFLGLRGLFVQASRAGDRTVALGLARRAFELRPNTPWAAQAVFDLEAAASDWTAALKTLDRGLGAKLIDRAAARRRRAVLLAAQAMDMEKKAVAAAGEERRSQLEQALTIALEAVNLQPDFAPILALAGRLCGALDKPRKGARLIEHAWAAAPHPALADAYAVLKPDETAYDRLTRMRFLAAKAPDHPESRVALAQAAVAARDWAAARDALKPLLEPAPSVRICELMAEIEDGQHGNRGGAREWLSRALHAPRDAIWVCDGHQAREWAPVCPATGAFDAMEWKAPEVPLAPPTPVPRDAEDQAPAELPQPMEKPAAATPGPEAPPSTASGAASGAPVILPSEPVVVTDDPGTEEMERDEEEKDKEGRAVW